MSEHLTNAQICQPCVLHDRCIGLFLSSLIIEENARHVQRETVDGGFQAVIHIAIISIKFLAMTIFGKFTTLICIFVYLLYSVVSGYDFVVGAIWPEVVVNIEAKTPSIFAPGNPNTFHEVCSNSTLLTVCL